MKWKFKKSDLNFGTPKFKPLFYKLLAIHRLIQGFQVCGHIESALCPEKK